MILIITIIFSQNINPFVLITESVHPCDVKSGILYMTYNFLLFHLLVNDKARNWER
jgi:hypothetical protein